MTTEKQAPEQTHGKCADCGKALWQYEAEECRVMSEGAHCMDCFRFHLNATLKALGCERK